MNSERRWCSRLLVLETFFTEAVQQTSWWWWIRIGGWRQLKIVRRGIIWRGLCSAVARWWWWILIPAQRRALPACYGWWRAPPASRSATLWTGSGAGATWRWHPSAKAGPQPRAVGCATSSLWPSCRAAKWAGCGSGPIRRDNTLVQLVNNSHTFESLHIEKLIWHDLDYVY